MGTAPTPGLAIVAHDVAAAEERLLADVSDGLSATPRRIPPKWFYDDDGSALFEKITRLAEYYPTEAERALLVDHAARIVELAGANTLVELGAGVSDKTTALLDAIAARTGGRLRFVAFDISRSAIELGAARLLERYGGIEILGVVGDFDLHIGQLPAGGRRLIALLGRNDRQLRADPPQTAPRRDRRDHGPRRPLPPRNRPGEGHGTPRHQPTTTQPGSRPRSTRT